MTFCEVSIFTIYSKHEFKTLMKVNFNKELEGKALMFTDIRATEHINFATNNLIALYIHDIISLHITCNVVSSYQRHISVKGNE
jgi:hypothetical protein